MVLRYLNYDSQSYLNLTMFFALPDEPHVFQTLQADGCGQAKLEQCRGELLLKVTRDITRLQLIKVSKCTLLCYN